MKEESNCKEVNKEENQPNIDADHNLELKLPISFKTTTLNNLIPADSNLSLENRGISENNSVIGKILYITYIFCLKSIKIADFTVADDHNNESPSKDDLNVTQNNTFVEKMIPLRRKQKRGYIDVWWLYDDGGLTVLIPYIISTRNHWSNCNLRLFALATNDNNVELESKK